MFVKRKSKNRKRIILFVATILVILAILGNYFYQIGILNQQFDESFSKTESEITKLVGEVIAKKEAKRKEPVYISLPKATTIRAIVEDYNQPNSIWVLVNKKNAISTKYEPDNLAIPDVATRTDKSVGERSVRTELNKPLKSMFADAKKAGISLMIGSGYRSASLQKTYLDSYASSVGYDIANNTIAIPGQSEHQTGLAVDITASSLDCYLSECFASTSDGKWLANNSYKYGFILRYPKGKETITGYQYEPWHFRYVGVDLATAIFESKLTLEEAWPYITSALSTLKSNGAIQ